MLQGQRHTDASGRGRGKEAPHLYKAPERLLLLAHCQHTIPHPLTGASHLGKAPAHLLLTLCKAAAPRTFAKRLRIPSCSSTAETQSQSLPGVAVVTVASSQQRTQRVPRTFAKRLCVSSCSRLACSLRCRSSSSLTRLRRKALRRTSTGRWFCGEGEPGCSTSGYSRQQQQAATHGWNARSAVWRGAADGTAFSGT